jgi:hypothetical protein
MYPRGYDMELNGYLKQLVNDTEAWQAIASAAAIFGGEIQGGQTQEETAEGGEREVEGAEGVEVMREGLDLREERTEGLCSRGERTGSADTGATQVQHRCNTDATQQGCREGRAEGEEGGPREGEGEGESGRWRDWMRHVPALRNGGGGHSQTIRPVSEPAARRRTPLFLAFLYLKVPHTACTLNLKPYP